MKSNYSKNIKILLYLFWALFFSTWAVLYCIDFYPTQLITRPCIIKEFTGFSCWACGGTRMLDCMIHLQFMDAFLYQPFFFVTFGFALLYLAIITIEISYNRKIKPKPKLWWLFVFLGGLFLFTVLRNTPLYLQHFYI